jgi:hypothetical protein
MTVLDSKILEALHLLFTSTSRTTLTLELFRDDWCATYVVGNHSYHISNESLIELLENFVKWKEQNS